MAANNEGSSDVPIIFSQHLAAGAASEENSEAQDIQSGLEGQVFDKETFLQAVREFKCLWDTSDSNYENRTMKVNAWNTLSSLFNQEGFRNISWSCSRQSSIKT